jgi:hypothetical protein
MSDILAFVEESNRIEGIDVTTASHVVAHRLFLAAPLTIDSIVMLVRVLQPDAILRDRPNVPGVRVGNHVAPPSGPEIAERLAAILRAGGDPWLQHVEYETLHPFTDGNGRSGRAVWLWRHMNEPGHDVWAVERGFLHSWYYHTLARARV